MDIAIVDDDKNSREYLAELLSSFNLLNINTFYNLTMVTILLKILGKINLD